MMYYTHLITAFLFGLIAINLFHINSQILFISVVLIAGLFPDIDHPKSKVGRYFRPLNFLFEHRGFFHSLLVLPLVSLLLYYFNHTNFALPVIVGYVAHLAGDSITKEGIMPLHPISKFRIKGFVKTGGIFEKAFFCLLVLVSAYFLLHS